MTVSETAIAQGDGVQPREDRGAQRFPRLSAEQIEVVRRFGPSDQRSFEPDEVLFPVGAKSVATYFLLEGSATLFGLDGLDRQSTLKTLQAGHFSGELNQLGDRPSLSGARAGPKGCRAFALSAIELRSLIVGSAELGELIMRAFILRRVGLLEASVGPVLLGRAGSSDLLRLEAFLRRSSYPHLVLDCASERGRQLINDLQIPADDLPLLICPCGRVLKRPSNREAGAWLGITPTLHADFVYDVAIIGAGPAGLATAVYAASEGLSTLVVDQALLGGQAGASARIENYLGFPTGISGLALAGRALNQAQKFGAEVAIPIVAKGLGCTLDGHDGLKISLSEQGPVRARTIVIASGARYKRPGVPNLPAFEGAGVHYWASPVEAKLCADQTVVLIGAGNSAGQAAVFLAPQVKRLLLVARGSDIASSMSQYLVERLRALANVEVVNNCELSELHGDGEGLLHAVTLRDRKSGKTNPVETKQLFVFIGAEPNTAWLNGCVALDERGYVKTGPSSRSPNALPLQTSLANVFAIGDVRSGSTKRVASAVGEGAAVVAQIHAVLGEALTAA